MIRRRGIGRRKRGIRRRRGWGWRRRRGREKRGRRGRGRRRRRKRGARRSRRRRRRTADIVTSTSLMRSAVFASAYFWITFVWIVTCSSGRCYLRFERLWWSYRRGGPSRVVAALNMAIQVHFETSVNICGAARRHLTHGWSFVTRVMYSGVPRLNLGTSLVSLTSLWWFPSVSPGRCLVTTVSFHSLSKFRWYVDREGYRAINHTRHKWYVTSI